MEIKWEKAYPDMDFSSMSAVDEEGNIWYMPANLETVSVTLRAGLTFSGWTQEEVWKKVEEYRIRDAHRKALTEWPVFQELMKHIASFTSVSPWYTDSDEYGETEWCQCLYCNCMEDKADAMNDEQNHESACLWRVTRETFRKLREG